MIWSNDPVADAERYYNEQLRRVEQRPVCEICGEHIQNEYGYYIYDEWLCEECLERNYRKFVEDFIIE